MEFKVSQTVKDSYKSDLLRLMRLDKPWGSFLLLWPSFWALWLANDGAPKLKLVAVFFTGAFLMRSFGCVINDWLDCDIDSKVERTKIRPLAANKVSKKDAFFVGGALLAGAVSLLFFLNVKSMILAIFGFLLTCVYPTTKRWMHCPQLFLGITFAWGIPMAYAASEKSMGLECWFLYLITALWIVGYDAIYAMQDLSDDKEISVFSLPKYANGDIQMIVAILYGIFVLGFGLLGIFRGVGFLFFSIWSVVFMMLVRQVLLVEPSKADKNEKGRYLQAFKSNQWVGFLIWIACLVM